MIRSLAVAVCISVAGWLFVPSPAHAQELADAQKETVDVFPKSPKVVTFDSPIIGLVKPLPEGVHVSILQPPDQLIVTWSGKRPPGPVPIALRTFTAVLDLVPTDDREKARKPLNVTDQARQEQERRAAELQARLVQTQEHNQELAARLEESEQGRDQLAAENARLADRSKHNDELSLLRQFDGQNSTIALMESAEDCRGIDVMICGLQWNRLHEDGVLRFVIYNATLQDLDVSQVFVVRHGHDHLAGAAMIGQVILENGATVRIGPMQRTQGSVIVHEPHQVGEELELTIAGDKPITSRVVSLRVIDLRPLNGSGRITIRVQPSFGAVWLANPVNKDELDATSIMGLGVRGSYAFTTAVSVEAEFDGIQSSDASFTNVPVDGVMGDILRSTKGARFLLGGALRIGQKYQPYARLGVGAQVVNHDVRFITGQNITEGPGDGLSLDPLAFFGTGLDIQLGRHWAAGTGFSLVVQSGGQKTLEGGIQLGYGWGGYVRD